MSNYVNIRIEFVDKEGKVDEKRSIKMVSKNLILGDKLREVIEAQKALDRYRCMSCKLKCDKAR